MEPLALMVVGRGVSVQSRGWAETWCQRPNNTAWVLDTARHEDLETAFDRHLPFVVAHQEVTQRSWDRQWVIKNVQGLWAFRGHEFRFEREQDAMLFKLYHG